MTTRYFLSVFGRHLVMTLLFLSTTVSSVLVVGQAHAEERIDGAGLSINDQFYQGTVNFVHQDSFTLIIDDYAFILEPVLRFNNASWSRGQVMLRIEQGDLVKMELGGTVDEESIARAVRSITVINR